MPVLRPPFPARVAVLCALIAAGCGGSAPGAPTSAAPDAGAPRDDPGRADRFDGRRAFAELRHQVELGPRPAGSATLRRLARRYVRRLPNGRIEQVAGGLQNVVGHLPGRKPALLLAAHYDTKPLPGFVGANDGAGGTAAVVEIARTLRGSWPRTAPELRFVLFDGEENPDDAVPFERGGLRGSKAYARRHAEEIRAMVLLDFIADRDLSIPYEPNSDAKLWARLRAAAARAGVDDVFPAESQGAISDDHVPFVRRGIPAIDLIDFDFPCWHKTCDDLSAVSQESLDKSGEAVVELLRSFR